MNTIILIKLIAAHLTGDFLLQSDKMCADKFSNHSTAKYNALVLHALIQAALAYVFVAQWNNWIIPVVIGVSHFIIDYVKSMFKRKDITSLVWDQLAHLCVMVGLWFLHSQDRLSWTWLVKSSQLISGSSLRHTSRYLLPLPF